MDDEFEIWAADDTGDENWDVAPDWQATQDKDALFARLQDASDRESLLAIVDEHLQTVPDIEYDYKLLSQFVVGVATDDSVEGCRAACEMLLARTSDELTRFISAMYESMNTVDGSVEDAIAFENNKH